MNRAITLLTACRTAKRESAMERLAASQRHFDQVHADCQQARKALAQAQAWRADLLARCALGAQTQLRETALPACEALLEQRAQHLTQHASALRSAFEHMRLLRQCLTQRERDLLRLDEWTQQRQVAARREQARREERQSEDLVQGRSVAGGLSA